MKKELSELLSETHFNELCKNYFLFYEKTKTLALKDFGGPSLYFHQRALQELNNSFLSTNHLEMIYATLTAWGMHRMGETKTKIIEFDAFCKSIQKNENELLSLKELRIENLQEKEFTELIKRLNNICFSLKVSVSNSKLVGNSKTLAHILPNLVPPIDRQYTIRFFRCEDLNKTPPNFSPDEEKTYFNYILKKSYLLINSIKSDKRINIDNNFNSSYPKIFDNLIVSYIKTSFSTDEKSPATASVSLVV